jgi:arginase
VHEIGLDIYDMRYIDEIGIKRAMEEALDGHDADTHLHVSFDVDFLDPGIAPGVGTTVQGRSELSRGAAGDGDDRRYRPMRSLDIVELNPAFDDAQPAPPKLAVDLVESLFGKSTLMRV